jgi:hypothetical protein
MQVSQLLQDVVGIHGITSSLSSVVLMLYGLHPTTLRIGYRLSDPPIVTEGATIVVIHVGASIPVHTGQRPVRYDGDQHTHEGPQPINYGGLSQGMIAHHRTVPPLPHGSKLLGNFKLSQFNGTSRQWKAWNKSFTRYLSIHQLDYVIEEGFLDLLPYSEDAFAANKLLHFRRGDHARHVGNEIFQASS